MPILGELKYFGEEFVYIESSFTKGSRQLLLISKTPLDAENPELMFNREKTYYEAGGVLDPKYIVGILDPVRKLQFGSITLLNNIYAEINEVVRQSKLTSNFSTNLDTDTYSFQGSKVSMRGTQYYSYDINKDGLQLKAESIGTLQLKSRALGKKMMPIGINNASKYNTSTFVDASMEYLERIGFDMSWMEKKEYHTIQSTQQFKDLVFPAFIKELKRWRTEKDFPYFLFSIDYESTGLNAFDPKHWDRSTAVYFSMSFADHQSFGVFLDMEHFENADIQEIADIMTNMTRRNIVGDRTVVLEHDGEKFEYQRSEITVTGHNFMIDRRFGMTVEADIWFDLCTNQLSFNLDPFMTKGRNGLKSMVTRMFDIEYAELGEICGPKNKGMFRYLTDKRVITMYGCADTDLQRMVAKELIKICQDSKEYFNGVDHAVQHMKLDSLYMNHKAECDYYGHRINRVEFEKLYREKTRVLDLYYSFMAQYVGRVKAYNDFEKLALNAERYSIDLNSISAKDIDKAPNYRVDKWTGKELLDVLFKVLNYPIRVWTQQNKKSRFEGRKFVPKPAVNTDALKKYMEYEATVSAEEIEKAMGNQESLEDLKWYSMYLKEDYVDPVTGEVLIDKEVFNSYRLPFMYILYKISPIAKSVTADLKPVVDSGSEYKFASCNMTSAVTRRDLNPMQTMSGKNKKFMIPYTDEYNYCAVDQAAVEIRILDGLSGDMNLVEPLNDPEKDSHTETTALMHRIPAHTVPKDLRGATKEIAFGIPYGKGEFSTCLSLFKKITPDNMAETGRLFQLYNEKMASVMKLLTRVRDNMDEEVKPPKSLAEHLGMDPEKKYGRMINEFGYCQHMEIGKSEAIRQTLRRKAGNFIIQGFAANLLRMIYVRLIEAYWKEGWLQDKSVMIHLTVHDEIDMSYKKTLNPIKFMKVTNEALTVKMKGFPTFFVGVSFGPSWGVAKDDASEMPVLLVSELTKRYEKGEFPDDYDFGDHNEFFENLRKDYFRRRVWKELKAINDNKNVWHLPKTDNTFTNYTVRALLPTVINKKPLFKLQQDARGQVIEEDQEIILAAHLPKVIATLAKEMGDNRTHYVVYNNTPLKVTDNLLTDTFEDIDALFANKPITITTTVDVSAITDDIEIDLDTDVDIFEDMDFDFGELDLNEEEYATDGIVDLNSGFLNTYNTYADDKDPYVEYGSIQERLDAEIEAERSKKVTYENFKVINGSAIISIPRPQFVNDIVKFTRGKSKTSGKIVKVYVKSTSGMTSLNSLPLEFLPTLDKFITKLTASLVGGK